MESTIVIRLEYIYPWVKAAHIISIIAWMAGLLYLPRLFVYHCQVKAGSQASELLKIMEYKLYKYIMTPAMLASFFFGILLASTPGSVNFHAGWFYVKLTAVLLMAGTHGAMSRWRKDFMADRNTRSQKFFRIANEIPTILMLIIVIMVVVQPF